MGEEHDIEQEINEEAEAWSAYELDQKRSEADALYEELKEVYAVAETEEGVDISPDDYIRNRSLPHLYTKLAQRKGEGYSPTTWRPISPIEYYNKEAVAPSLLAMSDGSCLLYKGKAHSFIGHFESLKSFAAMLALKDVVDKGENVFYVDMEAGPGPFWRNIKRLGIPYFAAYLQIGYFQPREKIWNPRVYSRTNAMDDFYTAGAYYKPSLIIIDGVTEFCAVHGLDVTSATDVALYQKMLLKGPWSGEVTTLEIDHIAKERGESGRVTPLGSQHKAAGIDGAVFYFESVQKGGQGKVAKSDIYLVKDREGFLNASIDNEERKIGQVIINTAENSSRIEPYKDPGIGGSLLELTENAPDRFDQKIVEYVRYAQSCSLNTLVDAFKVPYGKKATRNMVDMLVSSGHLYYNEETRQYEVMGPIEQEDAG